MKAIKALAILLLATFSFTAVSAQSMHHRKHRRHHKRHHHAMVHHQ